MINRFLHHVVNWQFSRRL